MIKKLLKEYFSKRKVPNDTSKHWLKFTKFLEERLIILNSPIGYDYWSELKNGDFQLYTSDTTKVYAYIVAGIAIRAEKSLEKEDRKSKDKILMYLDLISSEYTLRDPKGIEKAQLYSKFIRDWDNVFVFGSRGVVNTKTI